MKKPFQPNKERSNVKNSYFSFKTWELKDSDSAFDANPPPAMMLFLAIKVWGTAQSNPKGLDTLSRPPQPGIVNSCALFGEINKSAPGRMLFFLHLT